MADGVACSAAGATVCSSAPPQAARSDPNNSTNLAAWRKGKFLIAGYQGRWDPYFVADTGGEPIRVAASEKDDKPSDWWLP